MTNQDQPKLVSWNARSSLNTPAGINNLKILIENYQPDIIALQETGRYTNNSGKSYPLKIKGYQYFEVLPQNNNEKNKNSVAILIKNTINFISVNQKHTHWGVMQTIKILPPNYNKDKATKSFYLSNVYVKIGTEFDNVFFRDFKALCKSYTNQIITGDFNAKNNIWGIVNERSGQIREGVIQGDKRGIKINDIINNANGQILNDGRATRLGNKGQKDSAIDLTIAFGQYLIDSVWDISNDNYGSDHLPLIITIKHQIVNNYKHSPLIKFDIEDADWDIFREKLKDKETIPEGQGYKDLKDTDVNVWLDNIENLITDTAKKCFKNNAEKLGKIENKPKKFRHTNYWFNDALKAEKKFVNKKLKTFRLSGKEEDRVVYRCAKKTYETNIMITKRATFDKWANEINFNTNSKEAFRKLNAIQGNVMSNGVSTLKINDTFITSDKDKAEAFAAHYENISSDNNLSNEFIELRERTIATADLQFSNRTKDEYNQEFKIEELDKQLNKRKKKSATGSDGIEYRLIKNLPYNFRLHILEFFNYIYEKTIDKIPGNFTTANIITLLKPNKDPHVCASYRPISLTNHLGKLLEAMVNHRLKQFLEKNRIISPNQAGFRNKRECLDQVARIENEVRNINNKNYGVLAVFLDIEKAFDTACRPLILKILKESGIKGQMYNYIRAFLSNRTFRVKIGSELSEYRPLKNGVPQGAVLSPTLFFTNSKLF